ncbi:MAG TPA: hypothetical protein VHX44_17665 [Planctomycetota bacterium]|jgi:hypothetical protein|nr:hypothetical protein [Planctomycetota bacterium]
MNRIIPITLAQPGLVLGEAVQVDGQVLLAEGTTVTQAHLGMLTARGVRSLCVVVATQQRAPIETKLVLAMDRTLRPRFARTDMQHPAMKEMYRLALMRLIQQTILHAGKNPGNGAPHAG